MRTFAWAVLTAAALAAAGCAATQPEPQTTTTTLPAEGGQQVIITESAAASVRGPVNHRVVGEVTDVERQRGEVTVRTADGSKIKLRLPPMAAATVREGDAVNLDVTVVPRGR
ncbi:MAG TPA: hypothetical protein VNO23_17050 [Candidatus Binatia bacterium]|nr:hypothetical protein [Candidatus Binatia bacterium]